MMMHKKHNVQKTQPFWNFEKVPKTTLSAVSQHKDHIYGWFFGRVNATTLMPNLESFVSKVPILATTQNRILKKFFKKQLQRWLKIR
jgi:hypothetical protein